MGLIGGMSWQSTIEYYRLVNESIQEKLRGGPALRQVRSLLRQFRGDRGVAAARRVEQGG